MTPKEKNIMDKAINVIVDERTYPAKFIGVETDFGTDIDEIGERMEYYGITRIRITGRDINDKI